MKRFAGKTALVTGGSSGIGQAIAQRLAAEGARVAVTASSDAARAQEAAKRIAVQGGAETLGIVANVTSAASIAACVEKVRNAWGRLDILVNSAGVYYPTPLGETAEEALQQMLDTNLKGVFLAMNAVTPGMKAQGGGKIVNVASVAAFIGSKNYSLYCAVKAGVVALTKSAALELAPFSINVNAVAPGNTATPINEHIRTLPEWAERRALINANTPSLRKWTPPEDIANIAVFLASDESRAMYGATVLADEGRAAG
jgi:NAD(P)-dependent dehydrogenase (short-subunit alcohol dehydrogenase family)